MRTSAKEYIGDSVYCDTFDGYGVLLTTENGQIHDLSNTIALEPSVILGMLRWMKNNQPEYLKQILNSLEH